MFNKAVRIVGESRDEALVLFQRAAELGHPGAMDWLACSIALEDRGRAIELWQNAAEIGNANAMVNLALHVLTEDRGYAVDLMEQASSLRDARASYQLALLIKDTDRNRAISLLEQAYEQGNPDSALQLAILHVNDDISLAMELFEECAAQGDPNAANWLAYLIKGKDPERAIALFEQAIDKGNTDAMINLAELVWKCDEERARGLLFEALEMGDQLAADKLAELDCDNITRTFLYVIVEDNSSKLLSTTIIPINCDENTVEALDDLKQGLLTWHSGYLESVTVDYSNSIDKLLKEFAASLAGEPELLTSLSDAIGQIKDTNQLLRVSVSDALSSHFENSKISKQAEKQVALIEENLKAVNDDYVKAYNEQCGKKFFEYIQELKRVSPQIVRQGNRLVREYCVDLNLAFDAAELDMNHKRQIGSAFPKETLTAFCDVNYLADPLPSWGIVEKIRDFYQATLLDALYDWIDDTQPQIKGYSHRKLGWNEISFSFDADEDFQLVLKTNFGFGRSRYFHELLSYKGIKILNWSEAIYYAGVDVTEFAAATKMFGSVEREWKNCLDDAVNKYNDFVSNGAESFIIKYAYNSVCELVSLMDKVVTNNTFIQIKNLVRLNEYLNCPERVLVFDNEEDASNPLDRTTERILDRFVSTLNSNNLYKESTASESGVNNLFDVEKTKFTPDSIDKIWKARSRLKQLLIDRFPNEEPWKINYCLKNICPITDDWQIKSFEGYGLIDFRIAKANMVIALLPSIGDLGALIDTKDICNQLIHQCSSIAEQAKGFLECELSPLLARIKTELRELESAFSRFEKKYYSDGKLLNAYQAQSENIEKEKREKRVSITQKETELSGLEKQENTIIEYLTRVDSVRE